MSTQKIFRLDRTPMLGESGRTYLVMGEADVPINLDGWSGAFVVSIFSPNNNPAKWPGGDPRAFVRHIAFWDTNESSESEFMPCISPEGAESVAYGVRLTQERFFVFQCEAGVSRSAGLCVAVARYFGDDEVAEECYRRYAPNELVVERVGTAFGRKP